MKLSGKIAAVAQKYGMAYDDADVMEAAAELARMVEDAPVVAVRETDLIKLLDKIGYYDGQRVALVPVPTKGE